jgi:tetratricopeptide (TPR) repeat protein
MPAAAAPRKPDLAFLIPAALFALACVPFAAAVSFGFSEFDDPGILIVEPQLSPLSGETLRWMLTTPHLGHYHPLTWLSFALDDAIWGPQHPGGWHATNLLLHAVNTVLVYFVALTLLRLGSSAPAPPLGQRLAAAAAAALFAVHPLRVESVAWITERRDVLSACFLLLATLAYLHYAAPAPGSPRARWYLACIAFLLLSLLSKAWGMTFFVVALILDFYPLRRLPSPRWPRILLEKTPLAILGIVFAASAAWAQSFITDTVVSLEQWPPPARIAQACYGLGFYLWKSLWPTRLAALYELPPAFNPRDPRWLAGIAAAALLLAAALALRRRLPAFTAAAATYVVLVSPVLGLLQSGIQLVADRYSYLSTIPWAILAGAGILRLSQHHRAIFRAALAAAALAIAALSIATWRQTSLWSDAGRLFAHALEVGQDGPYLRRYYGVQLLTVGRKEDALLQFQRSSQLNPRIGGGWFGQAQVLRDLGRTAEAEAAFQKAAERMPDGWRPDLMRGLMLEKAGRLPEARAALESAVARAESANPLFFSSRPYLILAGILDEMDDTAGSRSYLQKAARYSETRAEALEHLKDMGG